MYKSKSEEKRPSSMRKTTFEQTFLHLPRLSLGIRTGYIFVSFLLGITYLKILMVLKFEFSPVMLMFAALGTACFAVCIFNLVSIWSKKG